MSIERLTVVIISLTDADKVNNLVEGAWGDLQARKLSIR